MIRGLERVDFAHPPKLECMYVDLLAEGAQVGGLRLLLCAFWRREAARLAYLQSKRAKPTARMIGRWVFCFGA
jgi:hypothetical protein